MGVVKTFDDRTSERWQVWLPWAKIASHRLLSDDISRDEAMDHFRARHRTQLAALREKGVSWTTIDQFNLDNPLLGIDLRTLAVDRGHKGVLRAAGKLRKRIRYDKWNRIRYPKRTAAAASAPPSLPSGAGTMGDAGKGELSHANHK